MKTEEIYQIILLVLANEATVEERRILAQWMEKSEENRAEYAEIKRFYEVSSPSRKEKIFDTYQAWQNVYSHTIGKKKALTLPPWLRYVAMVVIMASIGFICFTDTFNKKAISEVNMEEFDQPTLLLDNGEKIALNQESFSMNQKQVLIKNDADNKLVYQVQKANEKDIVKNNHLVIPKGKSYKLELADGTRIWLNSESELIYPTQFAGTRREVSLIGEAYFEVAKDKEKPFYVKTNGMEVRVLGTSFNVSCYSKDRIMTTTLVEGSVSVQANGQQQTISPSEQFSYNKRNNKTDIRIVDTGQYISWIDGKYIFKDAPLEEIIDKLQRWYDFTVVYQDESLRNKRFSLIAEKETNIDQLLEIVSYTSDVKLVRTGNIINIKKERRNDDVK